MLFLNRSAIVSLFGDVFVKGRHAFEDTVVAKLFYYIIK